MNKYKICVYAICKNEEKFVERFLSSVKEADKIYILDTGSTDNTVNLLKKYNNVIVKEEKISPFRFDIARNKSLEMLPDDTDICICLDLDEVLVDGWREELEKIWDNNTNRLYYNYNWSLDEENNPKVNFYISKIHVRHNYKWTHPVHEVLTYTTNSKENVLITDNITVNHYPDPTKSRSSYLPLLELSVKEDPLDDRNMHYLGREYMYYQKWNECIDTLICHLNLPTAKWKDERSASMRFISRSYKALKRYDEARMWLDKAINESPNLRDPLVERAILEYDLENYEGAINYLTKALEITTHEKTYINEVFSWDSTIYDLLSICYYYQNNKELSLKYICLAIDMDKNNERLKNNKLIFQNM